MSASHVVLPGSNRPRKADAKRIGALAADSPVEVTINLRGPALPEPDKFVGNALSEDQFDRQYGASPADVDRVAQVLGRYGLKVEETSLRTRSMRISGTVAAMEQAFHANLAMYHSPDQGEYRGREGQLEIPAELDGIVTGVFGLDERKVARRKQKIAAAHKPKALTPADLETRYRFPDGQADGQQIAIAEFDGGYFADDTAAFCAKYGRPTPNVTTVAVGLTPLTLDEIMMLPANQRNDELGASVEVMMDVEIIASLCSKAQLFVYFAPFTQKGWVDLLNKVISGKPAKPVALSVSWGLAEDSGDWSASARTAINERLHTAAALGITICVASGDDGSGDQMDDHRAHVDFPSSSPYVLSVGGTMLVGSGAHASEQVWWQSPGWRTHHGGATGGGVSTCFKRPTWQNVSIASLNGGAIDGRVVPDVAALAGPPFYDLIFMGHDAPNGGTSASAPLWSALIARVAARLPAAKQRRFLAPLLYQSSGAGTTIGATSCVDIVTGNNASIPDPGIGYQAQPGFDAVTGWGVPNGGALLEALSML